MLYASSGQKSLYCPQIALIGHFVLLCPSLSSSHRSFIYKFGYSSCSCKTCHLPTDLIAFLCASAKVEPFFIEFAIDRICFSE